ncbi:MAG: biopolymer transporter ExbD [Phycisphaerae bacterium]|nr:biopolymer transporter ExbD [Phycisphaerae bacterium]
MGKRLRSARGSELGINLTPMIDVVFLLLIFFVLIAQSSRWRRAQVELPEPEPSAAKYVYSSGVLTITVICDEQGKLVAYQAQGQMISPEQVEVLTQKLRDRKEADPQVEVNLRADRRADGQVVEALMAACAQAGISHVNLVAAME